VHANLAAHAEMAEPHARLHFYRTHAQAEVDFVLARGRRMIGLEVKASSTVRPGDAKGIEELASQFPRECPFGVVLYGALVLPRPSTPRPFRSARSSLLRAYTADA
jgi:hypothetical protein